MKNELSKDIKSRLTQIGSNVASLWGGECYGFSIDQELGEVTFNCIEHGEHFVTTLSYLELGKYDY